MYFFFYTKEKGTKKKTCGHVLLLLTTVLVLGFVLPATFLMPRKYVSVRSVLLLAAVSPLFTANIHKPTVMARHEAISAQDIHSLKNQVMLMSISISHAR